MLWPGLRVEKRAYDAALRRMGVPPDRPSAVWLDVYLARYTWLYRCERLRIAAAARRGKVTPDMRRVAKAIRQSKGLHLRKDFIIARALDDLERGGYIAPDFSGSRYGWKLLPAGVLIATAGLR